MALDGCAATASLEDKGELRVRCGGWVGSQFPGSPRVSIGFWVAGVCTQAQIREAGPASALISVASAGV